MPEWAGELAGYGPLGVWLLWQLYKDKTQAEAIKELTKALTDGASHAATVAGAVQDLRTYLMNKP